MRQKLFDEERENQLRVLYWKEAYFLEGQGVYYHVIKSRTTRSMSIFEISIENTGRYTAVGRKFESGSLLPVQDYQTDFSRP